MPIPFPTDGPQVQAALQKVPTPQLQQYAAGQPPQPTGQVTPGPMGAAAGALSQRNAMGAAGQRQTAMQNDPSNSPTIFQQLMMKEQMVNQQAQAIQQQAQMMQQKEQQLGVAGAMMAKKARDLAERERGIAQLPMRPDMFTAMNGGIVFNGGGQVERYASDGYVMKRDLTDEERSALQGFAGQMQNRILGVTSGFPRVSTLESDAPSTTTSKPSPPRTPVAPPKKESVPTTVAPKTDTFEDALAKLESYLEPSKEETLFENRLLELSKQLQEEIKAGRLTEQEAKDIMDAKIKQRKDIYDEYTKGRGERSKKMEAALRGQAPDLTDFLLAAAAGGPGKTFAETLSRMVPGTSKLLAEDKARQLAAAKYAAEADELFAKADMLQKMGDIDAAERARNEAEKRKKDEAKLNADVTEAQMKGIAPLLRSAQTSRIARGEAATSLLRDERKAAADLERVREQERLEALYAPPREGRRPTELEQKVALYTTNKPLFEAIYGKGASKEVSPRDRLAVMNYVETISDTDPRIQRYLSPDVIQAIRVNAASLKDPTSKARKEIREAKEKFARDSTGVNISPVRSAADILSGQ